VRAVVEDLAQVFVLADEEDLVILIAQRRGHRGDEVVRLEAALAEDRHAAVANDLEDALLLRAEVVGRGLAVGLVVGVDRLAEHVLVTAGVDDHREVIGLAQLDQVQQHLGEDECRFRRLAAGAGELANGA
jgi:hypothetical protein